MIILWIIQLKLEQMLIDLIMFSTLVVPVSSSSKTKAAAKLRVQTSRIVSSFKTNPVACRQSRQYLGHKDGVWDVDAVHRDMLLLATASAGLDMFMCVVRASY